MKPYFSIGEAAKAAHTTSETLRHYDRIGLVKPSKKDEWTNYRYYTEQDIVRLNTVRALQMMDLPLQEIKKVLEYDDLEKIIDFLRQTEQKADEKIAALQYSKSKIQLAKADYERKLQAQQTFQGIILKDLPERVILLSDTLEVPTLDNLWNYLSHFYDKVTPALKDRFFFEDMAGIYSEEGLTRLFALCIRYVEIEGLKVLPKGKIPLRQLYGGASGTDPAGAHPLGPGPIRRRADVYSTDHSCIRYFAMELRSTGLCGTAAFMGGNRWNTV